MVRAQQAIRRCESGYQGRAVRAWIFEVEMFEQLVQQQADVAASRKIEDWVAALDTAARHRYLMDIAG